MVKHCYFSFNLCIRTKKDCNVRLEYAIDYVKKRKQLSRKVFQIKEARYAPGQFTVFKKQSFQDFSTRKHYPGQHQLSIIVNGSEKSKKTFDLLKK